MRWACVLLPHLALDAVLRRQPDPSIALALVTGPAQRRVLHAASPSARRLGLRRGMLLSAAQVLTRDFETCEYDPIDETAARQLLATWAYGFSSQVSLDFPHTLVLEIAASRALFGDWPAIERRLRTELTGLGFRHRLAAAPNPFAARALANLHDGIGIDASRLERALGQIPVERSGLPGEVTAALARSGLRSLQPVFALPRESLARRFPPDVLRHLDAMRGLQVPPLTLFQPPDRFESRIGFDHEIESSQALLFPLRRMTADLAAFLCSRDGGVQRFIVHFEHERHADSELVVGLLAPERDASVLFDLVRSRLDHVRLPAAVRGLRLHADHPPTFVPAARDLFDTRPQQAIPWEQLRERLRARLGDNAVRPLSLRAEHRPEQATHHAAQAVLPARFPERPAWLLPQPMPLRGQVRIVSGPERIESGWWDNGDVRRDYYVVETREGQRAWAFTPAGQSDPLLLHGWFA
ncbi:DNA polymerase Y family protein [Luteimonas aestuarii]|uniref:DNA polymerase Y family protein n=1 Tax=Luteimonas aestuarii TaxID=453837 RepID=A0A4V6PLL6_9GAMM|nr:DNA polymerase Y family protein [Luteimonas aestuarii]TDK21511.1 DNA polymerase Y family protein [Luteimonas aestuarii]